MSIKIKSKQLTSGSETSGKTLITDGGGGFIYNYPIPKGTSFPLNPISGDTYYRTDVDELFYFDSSRNKWLTVKKTGLSSGRSTVNSVTTGYMYVGNAVQSSTSGFKIPYNGTILSVSIQNTTTATANRTLDVRVNNSTVNRIQLTVTAPNTGASLTNGNLDFSAGDLIQCVLLSGGDTYSNIIVLIEVARRI